MSNCPQAPNGDKPKDSEVKAGYLVIRLKPGEGVLIYDCIEVRLATSIGRHNQGEAQIAIRAPKEMRIRKLE